MLSKNLAAVPVIQWSFLTNSLMPINAVYMNALNATAPSDLFLKVDLCKLPINLLTLFIAIPFGIEGVVIGQFITRIIAFLSTLIIQGRYMDLDLKIK